MNDHNTAIRPAETLASACREQRARIRREFEAGATGSYTVRELCDFADETLLQIWDGLRPERPRRFALLALGGYGRRMLFPCSDLDILFLFEDAGAEKEFQPLVAELSRRLWDLGFRVSSAGRTVEECKRIEEDNAEFHLALLERRFLAGDREMFHSVDTAIFRDSERNRSEFLAGKIRELTRERHARYGNTIFHLEPNIKDAPGGLRDHHAALWLEIISGKPAEAEFEARKSKASAAAIEFLSAVRCFLHYANGRNDNGLTYELQKIAAQRALGAGDGVPRDPAAWMQLYFQHARALNRQLLQELDVPAKRRSFWGGAFWRPAGRRGKPIYTEEGRLVAKDAAALEGRAAVFAFLKEAARTGCPPAREAEQRLGESWKRGAAGPSEEARALWPALREILEAAYPAAALRPMHRLGLLAEMLPEFRRIDALVVRDFYHRYTVDEHSLRAIEHLQELGEPREERARNLSGLWKALERRDLLVLALLLHDIGKGMAGDNHVTGSLEALGTAAERLGLDSQERAEIHFLIEHHLDMSATLLRRDIFDPATIAAFARVVETQERLNRLCLLTYADIHAVNPEALTPWKAEMLWQLFAATSNHLSRELDRERLHIDHQTPFIEETRRIAGARIEDIEWFLEGFPRRYLAVHSAAEVAAHFGMYKKLANAPVQTELRAGGHAYSLTLLTPDRPALFATIAGVLAGWGMNIVKADAFANAAGIVLDTFHFEDLHRTLELNPGETGRFLSSLEDVVSGKAPLEPLLKGRLSAARSRAPKVAVETTIRFDEESSERCTLLELITQDRVGLLYQVGSELARCGCNIEVALIDTEGQKAIDVFYLTARGKKLEKGLQEELRRALAGPEV
ncbi:MAG: [protein-PII] uridylyltransferase [Acidobacteriia bacterium]|nr:[protein-PII] uridylyltransferase [Terriglobia bacterium]